MINLTRQSYCRACVLLAVVAVGMSGAVSNAAVTLIGTQFQQDDWFPEYNCIWKDKYYPTSCPVGTAVGCNIHAYLKNSGSSSVTINNVGLQGYDLATVLKLNTGVHDARSIYFYWDNPPQAILDAGEPVWYKSDPSATIPPGGVAQVVVRLRSVPTTATVTLSLATSAGNVNAIITKDAGAAQLASVGFSQDRTKVYLTWRRSGGAAPTTIKMDDVDVTASATTVGDPSVNYATTVLSFSTALTNMSYHVYQGVYSDGKTATASLRTWVNKFIHGTYSTFDMGVEDWVAQSSDHGINNCQVGVGGISGYMSTSAGAADCIARNYGYTTGDKTKFDTRNLGPDMFFINDEIDAEESNMERTFCGTGMKLPCGKSPMGILAARSIAEGETLRALRPNTPTSINMNGSFKPENYYAYGQAVDVLQVDPYYQRRLQDVYWRDQNAIPVYLKATYIYAVAKAVARAAEPNPSNVILYSCSWKCTDDACDPEYVGQIWPYADPEIKRIEAYYTLAAGTKGLCYWWMNSGGWPAHGLADQSTQAARDLWKEIGLYGNEIKTIAPQLVTSHPVDMTLTPGANVWARALANGTDTIILLAVNDNYYNDTAGFHHTAVANANVVAALPSWMTSLTPTAFEVRTSGLYDVTTSLNGSNLTVQLGTLDITRMIVITINPSLRSQVQARYVSEVWPGVCAFAPEHCVSQSSPPSITLHPSNQTTPIGGAANFTVAASGSTPLSYQWQKNSVNLTNTGHYSGVNTVTLAISPADSNDAANYRCVVTNTYGTATSNAAALTVTTPTGPIITQQPSDQVVVPNSTATFAITATGTGTLTYKWQKNLANITNGGHYSGATTATLTISSCDTNDAANYRCVATDSYGSTTSNQASLTVTDSIAPILANGNFEASTVPNPPVGWTTYIESSKSGNWTMQVVTPPEGAQWPQTQVFDVGSYGGIRQAVTGLTNGGIYTISGAYKTNSVAATASVRYTLNGSTDRGASTIMVSRTDTNWSTFSGTVTATGASLMLFLDHLNGTTSNKASGFDNIKVTCPPIIMLQPAAQSICPGENASFTVAASGSGTMTYLWQKNSVNLANGGHYSGVTTATLAITGADSGDAANYRCVVTNSIGSTNSNAAALTVKAATAITVPPVDLIVEPGQTAIFNVAATGHGTLAYQWQKDTINLANGGHYSGATTATLTVANADTNDAANYRCKVVGGCGEVISVDASLTVGQPLPVPGDYNDDGDVDSEDFAIFAACVTGPTATLIPGCENRDFDGDNDVDQSDFGYFQRCYSGENIQGDPHCAD